LWRGFYPGILFDDGLLLGFGLLLEEVGGVRVVGQRLGRQLGGGVQADQPHADVLLVAEPVPHFVQLPVQVIPGGPEPAHCTFYTLANAI